MYSQNFPGNPAESGGFNSSFFGCIGGGPQQQQQQHFAEPQQVEFQVPSALSSDSSSSSSCSTTTTTFGLLCNGRPVLTDFTAVEGSPDKLFIQIPYPSTVHDLAVFCLPGFSIPPDRGVIIYSSLDNSAWVAIGSLTAGEPSTFIKTGWTADASLAGAPSVCIGLSLESLDEVLNLSFSMQSRDAERLGFAQKVAHNLFQFLSSFSQHIQNCGERIVIPQDALDTWLKKFEKNFRADPTFLDKTE